MDISIFQSLFIFLGSIITEQKILFTLFILLFYIYFFNTFSIVKKTSIFLKNFLFSPKINLIAVYLSFIILSLIILSITFLGSHYLSIGFLTNIWIPQTGAYAIKHGLTLHQDFHTPFGFIYNGINYISLTIMESFPNNFHLFDMIMISSILFSLIVIALFYLMRINTKKIVPLALLLIILSIIPQARPMSDMFNIEPLPLWYASYNKHLWGLFLLQIIHLFCWKKLFVKNIKDLTQIEKNSFILFLIIQVICAYIFFNYKLNFFIASSLVTFSIFFLIPLKLWFKYITFSISLFLFLILFTFILTQYSYFGYLKDIYHTILSRGDIYLDLDYFFIYLFVFFLMRMYIELFKKTSKEKKVVEFLKYYSHKSRLFLTDNKSTLTKQFLFDFCIGLFLSIGIIVDKERSLLYFLVVIFSYLIINIKTINLEKGFYWILTILFVITLSFLTNAYLGLNYLLCYLLIFSLIRVCILLSLKKVPSKKKPSDFFIYYFHKFISFLKIQLSKNKFSNSVKYYFDESKSFLINNKFILIKYFLFDFCIGLSVLTCITVDSEKPLLYFLIVFLFYFIINTNIINIKRVCYLVLGLLFVINTSSLVKIAILKFYKEDQFMTNQSKHLRYKTHSIKAKDRDYPFILENKESMDTILNEFKKAYPDKYKDLFEGIVYNDLNYKMYRNNVYYISLLNNAFLTFHNIFDKNDRILMLDPVNPLPILLDLKPIQGSYHWFHLGYTFSAKTIHRFNKTFEESDFIYMPLLSYEAILKCHFYKWNFQHQRFILFSIHKYGFLFATLQKIKKYNLEKLEFSNPDKIKESCQVIEDEQKEIEKNQRKNILILLLQRLNPSI